MRKFIPAAAAIAAALVAVPAAAQDMSAPAPAPMQDTAQAPDGSKAFGFEPYFGVMGGWESFDNEANRAGIPRIRNANGSLRNNYRLSGVLVQGVAGVNLPLGPVFVGAEGNIAKSVSGDVNWQYGASGRTGFRAGDSGMFYVKGGWEWVKFDHFANAPGNGRTYNDFTVGLGAEVGPKDIGLKGITGNAGFRLRAEVSTFGNFHSFQPMLGVVTHF